MNPYIIAKNVGLLPEDDCTWTEDRVPLENRGVKFSWLHNFVRQVDRHIEEEWIEYDSHAKAAMYYDYDAPMPVMPEFPRYQVLNPSFLVPNLVKPLTQKLKGPLYARVPLEQRGKPEVFISHTWSQPLITNNPFCTLETFQQSFRKKKYSDDPYIWMDIVVYNQHSFETIASDMKEVIKSIGRVCLPLIDAAPFSRLWCLWEILCAYVTGSEIAIYEPSAYASDIGYVFRIFSEEFHSVANASTTLPKDKEDILNAMISTFGSIQQTDKYVHKLVEEGLSHEEDKPWNRTNL